MLTIAKRAERRTRKINKKIEKDLPLFVGTSAIEQFLTTEKEQKKRVKQLNAINKRYFLRLQNSEIETHKKAIKLREELSNLIQREDLLELDKLLAEKQKKWSSFKSPEYIADYWRENLKTIIS